MTPMMIAPQYSVWLLQAAQLHDTIVAKTMPASHSWFDYTSGTLQLIVLILAVFVLAAFSYVLLSLKRAVDFAVSTTGKFMEEARPIIQKASEVADDAREVVAMIKTDVERVTHSAEVLSDQMLDIAESVERRMDDISAVVDVVQAELEETVLSTTATLRGVRLGGRAMVSVLGRKAEKKARRNRDDVDRPRLRDRHSRQQRDAGD
jgi:methyl-accepting chemotaxis protein